MRYEDFIVLLAVGRRALPADWIRGLLHSHHHQPQWRWQIAYSHDPAGRLTTVNYGSSKTIAYTYTAGGDLTQRQFSVGSPGDVSAAATAAKTDITIGGTPQRYYRVVLVQ